MSNADGRGMLELREKLSEQNDSLSDSKGGTMHQSDAPVVISNVSEQVAWRDELPSDSVSSRALLFPKTSISGWARVYPSLIGVLERRGNAGARHFRMHKLHKNARGYARVKVGNNVGAMFCVEDTWNPADRDCRGTGKTTNDPAQLAYTYASQYKKSFRIRALHRSRL